MSFRHTIENEHFRLYVWPALGGHVSSLVDKADGYELLHIIPTDPPTGPQYDKKFEQPGWAECFPAIAAGPYVGEPYDGIAIPDHGELWGMPTTAVPTQLGITTVWHGLRFGYRFVRKLSLQGPAIVAEYTLVNLAPFEFRFIWAMHALMSRVEPVQFPGLNQQAGKWFATEPIVAPFRIDYPGRRRALSIVYASIDLPAYWGVWIDDGTIAAERTFAIEPTTGRYDALKAAIGDGSAGRIRPMATLKWAVRLLAGTSNESR